MSQPITTTDLLRRGRQIITPPGRWGKNRFEDRERRCALGALIAASIQLGVGDEDALLLAALDRLARSIDGKRIVEIAVFNDAPETSHEDVLRLFDRTIGGK